MDKPKHTPGPWWAQGCVVFAGLPHAATMVGEAAWQPLQRVNAGTDNRDVAEANAILFAAAPELLDALKAFVDSRKCIGWGEGQCDLWLGQQWHKALDAIRKATGEE